MKSYFHALINRAIPIHLKRVSSNPYIISHTKTSVIYRIAFFCVRSFFCRIYHVANRLHTTTKISFQSQNPFASIPSHQIWNVINVYAKNCSKSQIKNTLYNIRNTFSFIFIHHRQNKNIDFCTRLLFFMVLVHLVKYNNQCYWCKDTLKNPELHYDSMLFHAFVF